VPYAVVPRTAKLALLPQESFSAQQCMFAPMSAASNVPAQSCTALPQSVMLCGSASCQLPVSNTGVHNTGVSDTPRNTKRRIVPNMYTRPSRQNHQRRLCGLNSSVTLLKMGMSFHPAPVRVVTHTMLERCQ
jgi:hypothetical protein